ncbi:exosortase A [Pelagerythrobacter rhizovicinus]|uniref:Exosortase A n=1 Tax=Pelagerythrobacter rhizovicinus TaxID=2268576 RepID=A0A4Q2KQ69_9SPHN|nr:exosortase A [Pelagerythrobacter rhizovicinus]RXZ65772.1 exosortase A [Pelagerythrobacter rhizovicinus]
MPPEASLSFAGEGMFARVPAMWRGPLVRLAAAWLVLVLLTGRDWLAMADKWWNVSTYNHVLFVPPIVGWLVWHRRRELAELTPRAWWPGLVLVGGSLFVWLLGMLAGLNSASQLGAVLALPSAVIALLGPRVAAGLLFPLAYMLFLVPFGDELVPTLQMVTADIVIWLTHASGIPAVIEGVFIDTPVGLFEVAEACSGVQFLVAMLALGVLIAQTCFRSWRRRTAFLAFALALPILANGVRAWGTIYIAQWQGIAFAEGFDHIVYGWVFFAFVVAVLLAVSWRWFDREPDEPAIDPEALRRSPFLGMLERASLGANTALGAIIAMALGFALWATLASRVEAQVPPAIALPEVAGWQQLAYAPEVPWQPRASGAAHRLIGRYRNAAGDEIDVFYALYPAQDDRRDASAYGEGALVPDTPWRWLEPGRTSPEAAGDVLLAYGRLVRVAETSYRKGDLTTGSAARLKLATMRDRLLLRRRPTATLILSVEGRPAAEGTQVIDRFTAAIGDRGAWMDRVADLR